jgi:hypothetical protein
MRSVAALPAGLKLTLPIGIDWPSRLWIVMLRVPFKSQAMAGAHTVSAVAKKTTGHS